MSWWCLLLPNSPVMTFGEGIWTILSKGQTMKLVVIRWHATSCSHAWVWEGEKSYTFLVCKEYVWKNSRKWYIYHCYITLNPKLQNHLIFEFWNLLFGKISSIKMSPPPTLKVKKSFLYFYFNTNPTLDNVQAFIFQAQ